MNRLEKLLLLDGTLRTDVERVALFMILSGNDDLFPKVRTIYDFNEHQIIPDCLDSAEVDFCSSSKSLIRLAFNLYNGFPCDVLETFNNFDTANFDLALSAIKFRFGEI